MRQKIQVFIISLPHSKRVKKLIQKLRSLRIKYKIIRGVDGKKLNKKKLGHFYNQIRTKFNIDRSLSASEIGAAASHIKTYKHIIKKGIQQAIIMEDDVLPSTQLKKWITDNIEITDYKLISFFSWPSNGFLSKNKILILKKFKIYTSKTHLFSSGCYQINNKTCKKIIKETGGKVVGYPDWPFLISKTKITLTLCLPFLVMVNDEGISYLKDDLKKKIKNNPIKKIFNENIIDILRTPYYLLFIPFITGKYKNLDHYFEHFFIKNFLKIKNLIFNSEISVEDKFYQKNNYPKDIRKKAIAFLKQKKF